MFRRQLAIQLFLKHPFTFLNRRLVAGSVNECVRLAIPEPLVFLDKAERNAVRTEKNIAGQGSQHIE
jgi:hypothetical protein